MTVSDRSDIDYFMKRFICVLVVFACLFSAGCNRLYRAASTPDGFKDERNGKEYVLCNTLTLFAGNTGETYLQLDDTVVYTVAFEEPERFLCIEDSGEYLLYREVSVKEPDLTDYNPIAAGVFVGNSTFVTNFYADDEYLPEDKQGLNPSQDTSLCQSIASALTEDESVIVNDADITSEDVYFIRLYSQDFPGLYYVVIFFGDVNGRYYLRDRATDKTVVCPTDVKARMVG